MKILSISVGFFLSVLFLGYLSLDKEPIKPYILEIDSSDSSMVLLKKELKILSGHLGHDFFSSGNYPISIEVEEFSEEDRDDLGYALVDDNECVIKLNQKEVWNKNKLKAVLFHEIGHCYGLEHDEKIAVMNSEYSNPLKEIESFPVFFKTLKKHKQNIYLSKTPIIWWNNLVNKGLDIMTPTTKDSLQIKRSSLKKESFNFKNSPNKTLIFKD